MSQKIKIVCYIILFITLTSVDCNKPESDHCHHSIQINNQSSKAIYINYSSRYPDTTVNCAAVFNQIQPQGSYTLTESQSCLEGLFHDNHKIQFFIIDSDVYTANPCDSISQNALYLKRYELGLEDMNNHGWIVIYP